MKFSAGAQKKNVYCQVSEMQMICAKNPKQNPSRYRKKDINTTFKDHIFGFFFMIVKETQNPILEASCNK